MISTANLITITEPKERENKYEKCGGVAVEGKSKVEIGPTEPH